MVRCLHNPKEFRCRWNHPSHYQGDQERCGRRTALGADPGRERGRRAFILSLGDRVSRVLNRGGFDVVLGNPPWEKVQFEEKQFFAKRAPTIAGARNASVRRRMVQDLAGTKPELWNAYITTVRSSGIESRFYRTSGRFPLTGQGRINTYALFSELMCSVVAPLGRVGTIVPTGLVTDDTTKEFFGEHVASGTLISVYSFENEAFIFPSIHHAYRFCLLTIAGNSAPVSAADFVFYARGVNDLAEKGRHFTLTADEFALLNPNTRTCPTFRSSRDAEIAKQVYRNVRIFVNRTSNTENPWRVGFLQGTFNMASDSHLFHDTPNPARLPLYEAKLIHQYTHRWATYENGDTRAVTQDELSDPGFAPMPRYWVDGDEVRRRLAGRWNRNWLLGWRDITGAEKVRTAIAAVFPFAGSGGIHLVLTANPLAGLLIANLNSFVFDWIARQKVGGTHLAFFTMEQLPVLPPDSYTKRAAWDGAALGDWLRTQIVELVYTSWDLRPFALELGWTGPPFFWDERRRPLIRAQIDAAFFHLYGLDRRDVEHVMDSFWTVRDRDIREHGTYRTKESVVGAFDAMASGRFVHRLSPAPGDPAVAHRLTPGGTGARWMPWDEVASAVSAHSDDKGGG